MLRYLPGIIAIQLLTIALYLVAKGRMDDGPLVLALVGIGLAIALISALWFATISRHAAQQRIAQLEKQHLGRQEKIKVQAERQKNRERKLQQKHFNRETRRVGARANRKVALSLAGATAAGGMMLFTQFLALGLFLVVGSVGFGGGYLVRMRQEHKRNASREAAETLLPHSPDIAGDLPGRHSAEPSAIAGKATPYPEKVIEHQGNTD